MNHYYNSQTCLPLQVKNTFFIYFEAFESVNISECIYQNKTSSNCPLISIYLRLWFNRSDCRYILFVSFAASAFWTRVLTLQLKCRKNIIGLLNVKKNIKVVIGKRHEPFWIVFENPSYVLHTDGVCIYHVLIFDIVYLQQECSNHHPVLAKLASKGLSRFYHTVQTVSTQQ